MQTAVVSKAIKSINHFSFRLCLSLLAKQTYFPNCAATAHVLFTASTSVHERVEPLNQFYYNTSQAMWLYYGW